MKILMVESDFDGQILALLAFKQLNVAHSFDFVESGENLLEYLLSRVRIGNSLPDLILMDSAATESNGRDVLEIIRSTPKLHRLATVVYSMKRLKNGEISAKNHSTDSMVSADSRSMELNWILNRVCNELAAKTGWSYIIQQNNDQKTVPFS